MTKEDLMAKLKESPFSQLGELVYQYLLDCMVTLEIEPGALLNESRLAKQLGLSRTPVHSALEQLAEHGMVELRRGKNAVVTPLDLNEYYCIADIRAAVEGSAAALAAFSISSGELNQLKELVQKIELRAKSDTPYPLLDTRFHEIIILSSRNTYYWKAYELYRIKLMRYRWYIHLHTPLDNFNLSQRESVHHGLYLALKNHFPQQAGELAKTDAGMMRNTVLRF